MLDGRRILVAGMGRSGVSAAEYALRQGARVTVTDGRRDAPTVDGATHRYGGFQTSDFLSSDLIIVSPGVPASAPELVKAKAQGIPIVSELGFAAERLQRSGVPILAITGTNGKSSVAWFAHQLLTAAGRQSFVGGNFGTPLTELLSADTQPDFAVVEVSSYQLEFPGALSPSVAVCLNLANDHLGRHKSMSNYAAHKTRLFENMGDDGFAAIPASPRLNPDGLLNHRATSAQRMWLDQHPGILRSGDQLMLSGTHDDGPVDLAPLKLLGAHNRDNASAAVLIAVAGGVRRDDIHIGCLTALPHRLEPVHVAHGVTWVNDSKATNIDAAIAGISGLEGAKIVLLGGAGKAGAEYNRLQSVLDKTVRWVICFGHAGTEIAEALSHANLECAATLADAVHAAAKHAQAKDHVLLSPACASFDEFSNFEERGRTFTALAQEATA